MSNDFDAACRRMVHDDDRAFLAFLIDGFHRDARFIDWIDTRRIPFPGHPDQTGDLVAAVRELKDPNPPWVIPVEFQIEPEAQMLGWLLTFLGTLVNEFKPDVERGSSYQLAAIVVNLTGTSQSIPASRVFQWPGKGKLRKGLSLLIWEEYLAERSAKSVLAAVARGRYDRVILPWIPLMSGGSEPANISKTLRLARGEPDATRLAGLGFHLKVFAEKSVNPAAWYKALEGWGMVKSATMEATRNEERRDALIRLLRARTRSAVPADLETRIRACQDSTSLLNWADIAAEIDTIDQFRQRTNL